MNDAAYRKLARILIHHDTLKPRILLEVPWRAAIMPSRGGAWVELKGKVWVPEPPKGEEK